jgi:hypothetical protein
MPGQHRHRMRRSKLQTSLEGGRQIPGMFAPAGADFATPGVLSWSVEGGAQLDLVDLSHPWPTNFNDSFTVHGSPYEGEELTLLAARVRKTNFGNHTTRVVSWVLLLGDHVALDERWPRASYRPATLHEWLPETGLSIDHPNADLSRLVVEWNAPERRTVALPGAEITLRPGADWSWNYSPGWSIETSMTFGVKPDDPLTIAKYWDQYGSPLLGFAVFAADAPDDLTYESYYNPQTERGVVVLRRDRTPPQREWRPTTGHYLFQASHLPDVGEALTRWFDTWRKSVPSLGLFCETITLGTDYSVPRFLTLYTAAEGYWKNTKTKTEKTKKTAWSPRALASRAGISADVTRATDPALALIGASRDYHAHLRTQSTYSPTAIVRETYGSTRRLHALLQACLMREVGLTTPDIEHLLSERYRTWPIPPYSR